MTEKISGPDLTWASKTFEFPKKSLDPKEIRSRSRLESKKRHLVTLCILRASGLFHPFTQ